MDNKENNQLSISNFLLEPMTEINSAYGAYICMFKIKHKLNVDSGIHLSFQNSHRGQSVTFIYNYNSGDISELHIKDESKILAPNLSDTDITMIKEVLQIFLSRIDREIVKLTKELRKDWGKDFKSEFLERAGYCHEISNLSEELSKTHRSNIFNYTLSSKDKKNAFPFERRN